MVLEILTSFDNFRPLLKIILHININIDYRIPFNHYFVVEVGKVILKHSIASFLIFWISPLPCLDIVMPEDGLLANSITQGLLISLSAVEQPV